MFKQEFPEPGESTLSVYLGLVFFYYEIRLIAWELVDKRSSQQMQEVSKEEHEPQQFWGHRAQNIKAGMV